MTQLLALFIVGFLFMMLMFLGKLSIQLIRMEKKLSQIAGRLEKEIIAVFGSHRPGDKAAE
ncbi:MAG: hypothetical protein ABIA63_01875 [bacterium]